MQLDDICPQSPVGDDALAFPSKKCNVKRKACLTTDLCFRTHEEQNLVAYPANGKLFFCTTTEIHPEQELLFYYSRDYCRLMGEKRNEDSMI